MNQNFLRTRLKAKREVVRAAGYVPGRSISLARHERPSTVSHDILSSYSDASTIEIHDPRSNILRGHYFQSRNAYLVRDIIFEPRLGLIYSSHGELVEESTNWPIFQFYNSFPWNPKGNLKQLHFS